jgi:hypothetical protein
MFIWSTTKPYKHDDKAGSFRFSDFRDLPPPEKKTNMTVGKLSDSHTKYVYYSPPARQHLISLWWTIYSYTEETKGLAKKLQALWS